MFRPSTLKERQSYYRNEFCMEKAMAWFKKNRLPLPQLYAVDMGTETKIIKNKAKLGKMISLRPHNLKQKLVNYLPEDVYYDRNRYNDVEDVLKKLNFKKIFDDENFKGQQLAFDIDPENIKCSCKPKFPHFCSKCMLKAVKNALKAAELLDAHFKKIGLVYSGRGMHVHVFDKSAFKLSIKEREGLNKMLKGYGIDPWVSRGKIRLIRLPYSLNSLVSRIVLPLKREEIEGFNPVTSKETRPGFLLG